MLREVTTHTDWCEKTMTMLREKQFEACERRLSAHRGIGLFSDEATTWEAQELLEGSYFWQEENQGLYSIDVLRDMVLAELPLEALYISQGEEDLLERLVVEGGSIALTEWDDIGAAEALISRLWGSFAMTEEGWILTLPQALHEPLTSIMSSPHYTASRELLYRYDAMIHGLLYLTGFLHSAQPLHTFLCDVMGRQDPLAQRIACRYQKSAFEYLTNGNGEMILIHPGLADPFRLVSNMNRADAFALELSQEMVAGGMNGILPEEEPLHQAMAASLWGGLRPEYSSLEAAEDLRILAKQSVSLQEMEAVMETMLSVLPTPAMKDALVQLHIRTPRWIGLKTSLQQ